MGLAYHNVATAGQYLSSSNSASEHNWYRQVTRVKRVNGAHLKNFVNKTKIASCE
jgi:hypothetical protein